MNKKEFICEKNGETVEYSNNGDYVITCGDVEVTVSAYYGYIHIKHIKEKENNNEIFYMEFEGWEQRK